MNRRCLTYSNQFSGEYGTDKAFYELFLFVIPNNGNIGVCMYYVGPTYTFNLPTLGWTSTRVLAEMLNNSLTSSTPIITNLKATFSLTMHSVATDLTRTNTLLMILLNSSSWAWIAPQGNFSAYAISNY